MDVRCVPRPGGGGCFAEAGGCSLHVLLPLPLRVISSSLPVPVPSAYPVSHPLKPTLPSIFSPHLAVSSPPPFSGLQFHVECQLYTRPSVFWRPGREAEWWGVGYPRPGQGRVEVGWGP